MHCLWMLCMDTFTILKTQVPWDDVCVCRLLIQGRVYQTDFQLLQDACGFSVTEEAVQLWRVILVSKWIQVISNLEHE